MTRANNSQRNVHPSQQQSTQRAPHHFGLQDPNSPGNRYSQHALLAYRWDTQFHVCAFRARGNCQ